ncbi:OmpA/MotB family protein [Phycisphaera mikurensis]|uniref:Putative chemotaxis protein MotB n=1 Tax=Phycisphaera mikurensis (strain NBRC 102666 / KCTC 22515 / FYK2301M01) TaxID=1142394 RepID=I0IF83_PHYMF|nr:flagellar motor protein MotB [Phycisphaera mikurensis]BAM03921.1 putative chemotaxis protein MotB [Phycisphaera mikurensis NBRC 102666]
MSRKCKCPPEGAPEWMTTYGDMMTLLLCFFVLIVSFSEVKKEDEFQAVVREIKQAFGIHGGGGKIPVTDDPTLSFIQRLDETRMRQEKIENRANTKQPGQQGKEAKVTKIREGMLIGAGGRITFDPGSATLSREVKEALVSLVEEAKIRGTENVLELRGHADALELPEGGNGVFEDAWDLSAARAKAVFAFMTRPAPDGLALRSDRFRLSSNSSREPLNPRAYTTADAAGNRRVEVLVSETLVEQLKAPETLSSAG